MSKSRIKITETEWSYFFPVKDMQEGRHNLTISPNAEECRRLSLRLGILSIQKLVADLVIVHKAGDVSYHVQGQLKAELTQACAVTLEPVSTCVEEEFEAWFADPEGPVSFSKLKREREIKKGEEEIPVLDEKDDPEPLIEGKIDLGELVTQNLSLGINPYIRAEGVSLKATVPEKENEEPDLIKNPFAALKDWKTRQNNEEH